MEIPSELVKAVEARGGQPFVPALESLLGLSVRTCANEKCGAAFYLQEGRSKTTQRRTKGVKYCSARCAKAQAQREYRRRRHLHPPQ